MSIGNITNEAELTAFINSVLDRAPVGSLVRQIQARLRTGDGDPSGVVEEPVGTLWLRRDGGAGSTLYVKETGGATSSGWVAK